MLEFLSALYHNAGISCNPSSNSAIIYKLLFIFLKCKILVYLQRHEKNICISNALYVFVQQVYNKKSKYFVNIEMLKTCIMHYNKIYIITLYDLREILQIC